MPAPVWLILPTYNERDNLEPLLEEARAALAGAAPDFRILVVDDASPDGTGAIADRVSARHADVGVLHRPGKGGVAGACLAGMRRALGEGAELVLHMDADFSHDPGDLPRLVARARAGADVVLGSRYVAGGAAHNSLRRRMLSRLACRYVRAVLRVRVRDVTGGYRCYRAEGLERLVSLPVSSRGYAFGVEMTWKALRLGLGVVEVPITFGERRHGRSKMTIGIASEAVWRVLMMRLRERRLPSDPESRGVADAAHYTF